MTTRIRVLTVAFCAALSTTPALAQQENPPVTPADPVSVFGWDLPQDERLKISGTFIAGWSHDGAQALSLALTVDAYCLRVVSAKLKAPG